MAKKIVALVLAMTMVLGLFSTLSFAADDTFTIVDMNKRSVITDAGAKAELKGNKRCKVFRSVGYGRAQRPYI